MKDDELHTMGVGVGGPPGDRVRSKMRDIKFNTQMLQIMDVYSAMAATSIKNMTDLFNSEDNYDQFNGKMEKLVSQDKQMLEDYLFKSGNNAEYIKRLRDDLAAFESSSEMSDEEYAAFERELEAILDEPSSTPSLSDTERLEEDMKRELQAANESFTEQWTQAMRSELDAYEYFAKMLIEQRSMRQGNVQNLTPSPELERFQRLQASAREWYNDMKREVRNKGSSAAYALAIINEIEKNNLLIELSNAPNLTVKVDEKQQVFSPLLNIMFEKGILNLENTIFLSDIRYNKNILGLGPEGTVRPAGIAASASELPKTTLFLMFYKLYKKYKAQTMTTDEELFLLKPITRYFFVVSNALSYTIFSYIKMPNPYWQPYPKSSFRNGKSREIYAELPEKIKDIMLILKLGGKSIIKVDTQNEETVRGERAVEYIYSLSEPIPGKTDKAGIKEEQEDWTERVMTDALRPGSLDPNFFSSTASPASRGVDDAGVQSPPSSPPLSGPSTSPADIPSQSARRSLTSTSEETAADSEAEGKYIELLRRVQASKSEAEIDKILAQAAAAYSSVSDDSTESSFAQQYATASTAGNILNVCIDPKNYNTIKTTDNRDKSIYLCPLQQTVGDINADYNASTRPGYSISKVSGEGLGCGFQCLLYYLVILKRSVADHPFFTALKGGAEAFKTYISGQITSHDAIAVADAGRGPGSGMRLIESQVKILNDIMDIADKWITDTISDFNTKPQMYTFAQSSKYKEEPLVGPDSQVLNDTIHFPSNLVLSFRKIVRNWRLALGAFSVADMQHLRRDETRTAKGREQLRKLWSRAMAGDEDITAVSRIIGINICQWERTNMIPSWIYEHPSLTEIGINSEILKGSQPLMLSHDSFGSSRYPTGHFEYVRIDSVETPMYQQMSTDLFKQLYATYGAANLTRAADLHRGVDQTTISVSGSNQTQLTVEQRAAAMNQAKKSRDLIMNSMAGKLGLITGLGNKQEVKDGDIVNIIYTDSGTNSYLVMDYLLVQAYTEAEDITKKLQKVFEYLSMNY